MKLSFDRSVADGYRSEAQRIRVLTERWVEDWGYCPSCGFTRMTRYPNNRPVADFFCPHCSEDFELKSKHGKIGTRIVDGAYSAMIDRLTGALSPNLFLLRYETGSLEVADFLVIPKQFLVPAIIERRNPLAPSARRAGWIGCNILLDRVPDSGRVFLVREKHVEPRSRVLQEWKRTLFLRSEKELSTRGWLLDMMRCVEQMPADEFSLEEVYAFEGELCRLHPENRNVRAKIRQQLQVLRDKSYLKFTSRGRYRRIPTTHDAER